MSSRSVADAPAAWEHGLTPIVLKRLRIQIEPYHTPTSVTFDPEHYARLYNGSWGDTLARYALFQRLRRRENETEADHLKRQERWLAERRQWELENRWGSGRADIRAMTPGSISLGVAFVTPEQIAGSALEHMVQLSATGRVLVLDIASDKDQVMAQISKLIDHERETSGIFPVKRRGRKPPAGKSSSEYREFLKSAQEHQIVPLWDLQLTNLAIDKAAVARVLYPRPPDSAGRVSSQRSIPRGLSQKLERARELQDEVEIWAPRLSAAIG